MSDKVNMKSVLDRAIAELREGFVDAQTVADIVSQYQRLGHMDLNSSERVYPITIGRKSDTDYIMVDDRKISVSLKMAKRDEPVAKVWLNTGVLASIDHIHNRFEFQPRHKVIITVDDGPGFHRPLVSGDTLWVTEEMFNKAFYPFRHIERDGHTWREPMQSLKEALEN